MADFKTFIYAESPCPTIQVSLQNSDLSQPGTAVQLQDDIDQLLCQCKSIESVAVVCHDQTVNRHILEQLPVIEGKINRHDFYQLPLSWHRHKLSSDFPKRLIQSDNRYRPHPARPPMPQGCVYRRYDFDANLEVSFRVVDLDKDIERFTRWMNDPRVAHFWEQAWPKVQLAEFLRERLADPHLIPLIGEINGQPFGYVEVYWVAEDRLSPYYDVQDFDRGIHLLVGEQAFRGPEFFHAWMRAISHYLFIDELRTQRIVLEPRADNERLFTRILPVGYHKCFEFNFPHKRSALLMLSRDRFFAEQW
ncbi:GNAT family N-acetyltransferase [Vibrio sp.]|uniref:GNAT family N-acetyltransferase n=1 Tax=Vibrio sp. TaxID=678 RepID=UPI003D127171